MSSEALAPYSFPVLEEIAPTRPQERAELLAEAHREAARLREHARAEGERMGYAAGLERAAAEQRPVLEALAQTLEGARRVAAEQAVTLERDAVDLALRLAEKILAGTVKADPDRVLEVIRGGLRRLTERHTVTIVVSEDSVDRVRAALDGLRGELGGLQHCEVQGDRRVDAGGALIRTVDGEIDLTLSTQLERARELAAEEAA
jgi:flagellar assembly protein FliH